MIGPNCGRASRRPTFAWVAAAAVLPLLAAAPLGAESDLRLVAAAEHRDLDAVHVLLEQGVDANAAQADGAVALHWAAHWDELAIARALLAAGARVDAVNEYGVTPLSLAALNGSDAMVSVLLDADADPKLALPSGETPLMTGSRVGATAVAARLVDEGARVDHAESVKGQTALMWALSEGHLDTARLLLDRGADVYLGSDTGMTPLLFAARYGDVDAVRLLLDRGARVEEADEGGVTPLLMATVRGHADVIQQFLDHGADPNAAGPGFTALHWAAGTWETSMTYDYPDADGEWKALGGLQVRKLELIKALLDHGADVNARVTKSPPRFGINMFFMVQMAGATPFWIAALSADLEVMRLLVAHGADPAIPSEDGVTPLMVASGMGRIEGDSLITDAESIDAARFCLEVGNEINAVSKTGETALHGAAWFGLDGLARVLVEQGADMTIKDNNQQTPQELAEGTTRTLLFRTHPSTAKVLRELAAARARAATAK